MRHDGFFISHPHFTPPGTKAFSNVTSGLAKLNPMSSLRMKRPESVSPCQEAVKFYLQVGCGKVLFVLPVLPLSRIEYGFNSYVL